MRKTFPKRLKLLLLTTFAVFGLSSCSLKKESLATTTNEPQKQVDKELNEQIVSVSEQKSPLEPSEAEATEIATPPVETSLWDYMAARQELTSIQHARISSFEQYFLKHKRLLKKKTDKAAPYLYYIIQELEKRNMPLELAFTPMVESNFDPLAHSVVQAAGLWQFMPKTAKGFGLKINQWYDGRRDIVASTEAALNYYQYLNKMFDGDWLLTVAAYNVGEGNVLKAIKKNRKAGKATDYWSLKLPKETMRHVPKWLALSNILINQPQFGLALTEIKNSPVFASLEIEAPANLAQLATLTGLDKSEFYGLNPAYNKLFIPAEIQNASILVPIESLEDFEFKLQNTPAELFKVSFSYQVKAGDNLSKIAHKHQTKVTAIKKLNGLKSDRLQIGEVLKLPGMVEVKQEEQAFFSTLSKNQKRRKYKIYKVRSGDSLWKIARKFKVTTAKIAKWNGLNKKKILKIGQPLKIWPSY